MIALDHLFRSWQASSGLHVLQAGATASEIEEFEQKAGWTLPSEWRAFYTYANGATLFDENVRIAPLLGKNNSLLEYSADLRHHKWPIPRELWIAGGDDLGNKFGLWL